MIKVAPSILSADFSKLGEEISLLEQYGADLIHIDVMDGVFVPNITIGPDVISSLRGHSKLPFDVHLMISCPEQYIQKFAQSGADIITIHAESTIHLDRLVNLIKSIGKQVGVSLNPATSLTAIENVLEYLDTVLIMSVNPGFGGQKFIQSSINKIQQTKEMILKKGLDTKIEVDGGINFENAKDIIDAGADILVVGSTFFNSQDRGSVIRNLKKI